MYSQVTSCSKLFYLVGDLNLNVLDYDVNEKVKKFLSLTFQHGLLPVINKPTGVTKTTITAIDHINTNSVLSNDIKTGILKADISDHFPIFLIYMEPALTPVSV